MKKQKSRSIYSNGI